MGLDLCLLQLMLHPGVSIVEVSLMAVIITKTLKSIMLCNWLVMELNQEVTTGLSVTVGDQTGEIRVTSNLRGSLLRFAELTILLSWELAVSMMEKMFCMSVGNVV